MKLRRVAVATSLLMVFSAPAVQAAVTSSPPTPYPGGKYTPPAATYGTSEDQNIGVIVDDGTRIAVDVVYPTDPTTGKRITGKTFPVLLTQDPYAGSALSPAENEASGGGAPGAYFVQRGYIFVHMDIRGSGNSQGLPPGAADLFDPREGLDGLDVAYWAADPANVPGSNGSVGLEGCSALGISELATLMQLGALERLGHQTVSFNGKTVPVNAETNPIRASIPQCLSGNMYSDTFFDNGIPSPIVLLDNPAIGPVLGGVNTSNPSVSMDAVQAMSGGDIGYYRSKWQQNDRVAHADDVARTGVPILGWVGYGEGGFIGAQQLYGVLQNAAAGKANPWGPMDPGQKPSPKYQMIIGDWGHAGGLDQGIEAEWYDTWMKGVDTGLRSADQPLHLQELLPGTRVQTIGSVGSSNTERFINQTTYPELSNYSSYYLANSGALATKPQTSGTPDQLVWGPQQSVTYELNQPFSQDMTIMGPSAVRVWVSSSNTNTSLFAELEDVDPSSTGTVTAIEHGSILESRHSTNSSKSWTIANGQLGTASTQADGTPISPYLNLEQDNYSVPANTPVELDIPLQPMTWRLAKGHLLELEIMTQAPESECALTTKIGASPTGCVYTEPMLQTLPGGVYQILHDSQHPSEVSLAMVPSSSLIDARAQTTPTSGGVALPSYWGG